MKKNDTVFDVAIVGSGMVGSSLALALSKLPLKVALIDPYPQNSELAPAFDARAIALSWGSARIFKGLGIWSQLQPIATPINQIHISDRGHPGITRLDSEQFNVSAMGQVVELEDVGKLLHKALLETKTQQLCPAKVIAISHTDDYTKLELDAENKSTPKSIKAKLVVAADGNQSVVRKMSGINIDERPYSQVAVISTIQTQLPHKNVAYERFTETGPVAFLPLSNNRISLVWMMDAEVAEQRINSSDSDFINHLQTQFGQRLGRITRVGKRYSYPLNLVQAKACIDKRLVIIGNAAQSLHPIAGQGFNLGLRDVATLSDILRRSCLENIDPGMLSLLEDYQQWRKPDRKMVVEFTDTMARLFTNPATILTAPRNLMLMTMSGLPPMRRQLAEAAMGLTGKQPRLVRGLTLDMQEK